MINPKAKFIADATDNYHRLIILSNMMLAESDQFRDEERDFLWTEIDQYLSCPDSCFYTLPVWLTVLIIGYRIKLDWEDEKESK